MMNILVNVLAFKIGWAASVMGAANGLPLLGPAVVCAVIALHLFKSAHPPRELLLILATAAIGAAWDSVLVAAGWVSYVNGDLLPGLAPYWIVTMWMLFATTLNFALRWLQSKILLASVLGAISGPASYWVGAKIGAVELDNAINALLALGVAWAILLPALLLLARRLNDVADTNAQPLVAGMQRADRHV